MGGTEFHWVGNSGWVIGWAGWGGAGANPDGFEPGIDPGFFELLIDTQVAGVGAAAETTVNGEVCSAKAFLSRVVGQRSAKTSRGHA
jgi:hypothetical protein